MSRARHAGIDAGARGVLQVECEARTRMSGGGNVGRRAGNAGRWRHAAVVAATLALAPAAFAAPPGASAGSAAAADSARVPAPSPASNLSFEDVPNDAGRSIALSWKLSPDDSGGVGGRVAGYAILRAPTPGGPWTSVDSVTFGTSAATDGSVRRNTPYFYRLDAYGPGGSTLSGAVAGPAIARSAWFNGTRSSVLAFTVLFFGLVLYYMFLAHAGKRPYLRRLAGIDAIEEAIGRATEMGRPVLFLPGIQDIDELQTVAGLVILESVAKLTARYATPIRVPVAYPIPFTIAQEVVRSAYANAGATDAYEADSVRFVSPEQFAYVAAVTGIMLRDRPAAHIFMGSFYGESLMLAETGFSTGAIQLAGTANVLQLPFFVVACDYTLIGEELFAASAYLSGEPRLVGGLKGADALKLVIVAVVIVGCVLESFGIHGLTQWMQTQ
jgi:hypothetical protein